MTDLVERAKVVAADRHGCDFLHVDPSADTLDSAASGIRCFSADVVVRKFETKLRQNELVVRASEIVDVWLTWLLRSFER